MSGLDEKEELWILTYYEYCYEDYITCYRGFKAINEFEAIQKGKLWIKYLNQEYNESEDEENPDYRFGNMLSSKKDSDFHITDSYLEAAEEHIRQIEDED
jgi:hypothetical protein